MKKVKQETVPTKPKTILRKGGVKPIKSPSVGVNNHPWLTSKSDLQHNPR